MEENILYAPNVKVLLVDDSSINRKVFKSLLEGTGILLTEAASGAECLEYVQKEQYDIIFLDHMMPEMDGVETFHQMKQMDDPKNQSTPVIALTANVVDGAKEFYLEEGFDGYLAKPVDAGELGELTAQFVPAAEFKKKSGETEKKKFQCSIPIVQGFSWEEAMKHFPEEKVLKEVLEQFYNSIPDVIEKIETLSGHINEELV